MNTGSGIRYFSYVEDPAGHKKQPAGRHDVLLRYVPVVPYRSSTVRATDDMFQRTMT